MAEADVAAALGRDGDGSRLPSGGAVRVSPGLASDVGDLDRFLDFAERTYHDADPDRAGLAPRLHC